MVAGHLQTKKGHYYMVLNLKDSQGKRKPKWLPTGIPVGGKKNEKAAQDMLMETRFNYKEEPPKVSDALSIQNVQALLFADYMEKWLSIVKNAVEEDSYAGYKRNIEKRIAPYFRERKITLQNLTALDIEEFYEYCFNTLGVKGATVRHYHANMFTALKYAVRHDLIQANPMERVDRPKAQKFIGAFYSLSELEKLFEVARGDPLEFPILMAAFYGLRRSEIIGLKWQAVDFENNTFTISHTVVQTEVNDKLTVVCKDRTKNSSSFRSMPLVPQYRDLLLRMKEQQAYNRKLCGNCYIDNGYIYVNPLGELYKPNYVSAHFKLLLRKNGLREIRFHDLRHTCASLLLKNGVAMRDIQEWLGHSNFSTTAETYAHLETTAKNGSAKRMEGVIQIAPSLSTGFQALKGA